MTLTFGCSCACECHVGLAGTVATITTDVFDLAFRLAQADPGSFKDRVHSFRVDGYRCASAVPGVHFVVCDDGCRGFGVRAEQSACGGEPGRQVLARPGDVLGIIAGLVCPRRDMVENCYCWNLRSDSSLFPAGYSGILDASKQTCVTSLINAPSVGQTHNCCAISHPSRAFMLLCACQTLHHGDMLYLSYTKETSSAAETLQQRWTLYADVHSSDRLSLCQRACVCTNGLLHPYSTGHGIALSRTQLQSLVVSGVYDSIEAAVQQQPVTALTWTQAPLKCVYAVTRGKTDATETVVSNLLYEAATGTLIIQLKPGSLRIPAEAIQKTEALGLYVNLHRWNAGECLQKLSLAEVPPLGPAHP